MTTTVVRSGVLLQGDMLDTALRCVLIASHARVTNGLSESRAYRQLAEALAAAARGQSDVPEPVDADTLKMQPTVPLEAAASKLGLSRRRCRRLAPKLGGRLIGGRWLVDEQAVQEHLQGRAS